MFDNVFAASVGAFIATVILTVVSAACFNSGIMTERTRIAVEKCGAHYVIEGTMITCLTVKE